MRTLRSRPGDCRGPALCIIPLILWMGLAASAPPLEAQADDALRPGVRVRLTAPSHGLKRAVGLLESAGSETLRVRFGPGGAVADVAMTDLEGLEVSVRRERRVLRGAGIGLLVGAGSGAILGLLGGDDPPGLFSFSAGEKAALGAIAFGSTGLLIGVVYGAFRRYDVWSTVGLPRDRVTLAPSVVPGGGVGFRMTIPVR